MIKSVTIGSTQFQIGPISAIKSFTLQPLIFPVVAEVISSAASMLRSSPDKAPEGADVDGAIQDMKPKNGALSIGALGRAAQKMQLDEVDVDGVVPLVGRICSALPANDLETILRTMLANTIADGDRLFAQQRGQVDKFDTIMAGRTMDTWRLVWEAFRVVYADFFGRLSANLAKAEAADSAASTISP